MDDKNRTTHNAGNGTPPVPGEPWSGRARRLCARTAAFFSRCLKEGFFPLHFTVILTRLAVVLVIILIGLQSLKNAKPFK